MKNKILVLGAVITAFTLSSFAGSGAATSLRPEWLQPSAQAAAGDSTVTTIAYVDSGTPISPRAKANQIQVIQGTNDDQISSLDCRKNMVASPKAVAECSSHATMPGCKTVAMSK
jgi:hypothetical protein